MPSREQLETALINADKAGDVEAATMLANALKAMDQQPQQQQEQAAPEGGTILNALGQGATFGFADELGAAGATFVGKMLPESMGGLPAGTPWQDAYTGIRDNIRQDTAAFAERNPGTAIAAEFAGGLATGGLGLAKLMPTGANLVKTAAAGAGIGAAEGGLYGYGSSDGKNELGDTVNGAIIGGIAGGLGSAAFKKVSDVMADRAMKLRKVVEGTSEGSVATVMAVDAAGNRVAGTVTPSGQSATPNLPAITGAKLKTDKLAKEVVDQGFGENFVQLVKTANPEDRQAILEMVKIGQNSLKDARFAATNRVSKVVGKRLVDRVNGLNQIRREAARKLDDVASNLKGLTVDYSDDVNTFLDGLKKLDIGVNDVGDFGLNLKGSMIEGADDAEAVLTRIVKRMKNANVSSANDVHKLKRFIDNQVTYGKGTDKGLKGEVLRLVKELRHNINETLGNASPEYKQVNTQFSDATKAIEMMQESLGKKVNLFTESAGDQLGIQSRKLLSNYVNGTNISDAILNAEKTLGKYNVPVKGNIMDLVTAESAIRGVVPQKMFNTFQGDIEKAGGAVASALRGDKLGMIKKAGQAITGGRRTNEKALSSLEALLKDTL